MTREELIKKVRDIISNKSFSEDAKRYLEETFLFMYDNYDSKKYNGMTKDKYLESYLSILQELKGLEMVREEDLKRRDMKEFREDTIDEKGNQVTFKEVDGEFIAEQQIHTCLCSGVVSRERKTIYLWEEIADEEKLRTIHHEMKHVGQGLNSYYISDIWPLAYLIHVMLEEGEAVFSEQALGSYEDFDTEVVDDVSETFSFETGVAYPFYGVIYQLLGLILGFDVLEELGKNDLRVDCLSVLKDKFSKDMIDTIYVYVANMINIYNLNYPEFSDYNRDYMSSSILKAESKRKKELNEVLSKVFSAGAVLSSVSLMMPNKELFQLLKRKEELQDTSVIDTLKTMQEAGISMNESLKVIEGLAREQISLRPKEVQEKQLEYLENILAGVSVRARKM